MNDGVAQERVIADDGVEVPIRLFHGRSPGILVVPAMGVRAAHYDSLADSLHTTGTVAVMELRGNGDSPLRPSRSVDWGYADIVDRDIPAAVDRLRELTGGDPFLVGHSLGGQCALLHAATAGGIAGVALPATNTIHWKAYQGGQRWRILAFTQFAAIVATLKGNWPGRTLGFGGTEARTLIRDWARVGRTGRWDFGGRGDRHASLAKVDIPILSITVPGDPYATRRSADQLLALTSGADITRVDLDGAQLGGEPGHVGWLRNPARIAEIISEWIGQVGRRD